MRILFMGGHELGAITLEYLLKKKVDVVGVVITKTDNDWYSGVDKVAKKYDIQLYEEANINSDKFLQKIENINIDLIVSVNFEQILKTQIINIPKIGCINTHASLLPKYRGRAPLNWAMINGEKETGVTVHFIEEGIDTGNIIIQKQISIEDEDYIEDLLNKVKSIYPSIVYNAIQLVKDSNFKGTKQEISKGSYYGKRCKKDGIIDLNKSGKEILNLIRAVSKPYPGAFIDIENTNIIIWKAKLDYNILDKYSNFAVGDVIEYGNYIYIKLKDSVLIVQEYSIGD